MMIHLRSAIGKSDMTSGFFSSLLCAGETGTVSWRPAHRNDLVEGEVDRQSKSGFASTLVDH
jgi:hypothetical protein